MKAALMRVAGAAGALFACVACSSTVNQEACRKYVERQNELGCVAEVDVDDVCPPNFDNDGATDCEDFFTCLTDNARCDGETFVSGADDCGSCEVRS